VLTDAKLVQRFETYFEPEPNTGCWLWHGGTNKWGYGKVLGGA
jgi:hypothetical protein